MSVFDPSDDDLRDFVEKNLSGHSLQSFAESLHIPVDPSLVDTGDEPEDEREKTIRMLQRWRQQGNEVTMETLRKAMHECTLDETPDHNAGGVHTARDAELKELFAAFHASQESRSFRVVVLHGAAGIGKTFLAQKFVEQYKSFYPDGVIWISAESSLSIHQSHYAAIKLHNYHTFSSFVDDLRTVHAIASEKQGILFIFDNAEELELVEACIPPITSKSHVLVITRSQSFQGAWTDVAKIHLQPLDEDQAIAVVKNYMTISEDIHDRDDEALKKLAGKDMATYLPLALVYAAKKLNLNHDISPSSYVEMFSKQVKSVQEQLSSVSGWLKFYHLSHVEEELKLKFDVESVADIRSLSDGQIQRLGLSFFDRRRLKSGITQLKSDKPIKLPLWEMEIHNLSSQSSHAWKVLSYCALLSLEPIPEYILRECLMEHISPFSEQRFQEAITQLVDTGFMLQEYGVSVAGNTCYCMPSRIQLYVRRFHLTDLDVQYALIILSQVIANHLPSSKDIPAAMQCMDPLLVEILSHTQALAKIINQANVLDQTCEMIIDFVRVIAVTIKDPWLELSLCQQGVQRAIDKRLQSEQIASRMLDLAVCLVKRQRYDECQQTLHEAQVIVKQLHEPPVSANVRVFMLQTAVFQIQLMFHSQFAGNKFSQFYLSGQGPNARLIDLVTQYSLESDEAKIRELMSLVVSATSGTTDPADAILPHYMNRLPMLGVKSVDKVMYGIMQDTLKDMDAAQVAQMADLDTNLNLSAVSNRRIWKALLSRNVPSNVNLANLNYWQSCGQYFYNVGNATKALVVFRKILTMLQHCLPSGHPSIGDTLKWIGDCHLAMDDKLQAFNDYFQASHILSLSNQSAIELAKFFTNFAKSCSLFKPELAEEKMMHSLQLFERMSDPVLILAASYKLANLFYVQKQYDRALEVCQSADARLVHQFGQLNLQIPGRMICMALIAVKQCSVAIHCLREMGDYQSALVNSEAVFNTANQATAMAETFASGQAILADIKLCVGDCLLAENLTTEALSSYREALLRYETSAGKGDPKMIAGLLSIARVHQTATTPSNEDQAVVSSIEALSQVNTKKNLDKSHVEYLGNLVTYFVAVGDQDSAQMALEASMAVSEMIESRATSHSDEDISLPWNDSEPIPSETETHAPVSSGEVPRVTVERHVSHDLPASMLYSIKPLSAATTRDLLAWSCTPSMFTQHDDTNQH